MDYETREERRYALRRILWDGVFCLLSVYFSYIMLESFLAADRTAGWTSQSYISIGGIVVFLFMAALLARGLVKKIKRYREEFGG